MTFLFRCDAQIKQSLPLKRNKLIVLKLVLKKTLCDTIIISTGIGDFMMAHFICLPKKLLQQH